MNKMSRSTFKDRLSLVMTFSTGLALLIAGSAFFTYDYFLITSNLKLRLQTIAHSVAASSTAAIARGDVEQASKNLTALNHTNEIDGLVIYDMDGNQLIKISSFNTHDEVFHDHFNHNSMPIMDSYFHITEPLTYNDETIGHILLLTGNHEILTRLKYLMTTYLIVLLGAFLIAIKLSGRLQTALFKPLHHLTEISNKVSTEGDFSIRAEKASDDDIGLLVDNFNIMLDQIQLNEQRMESLVNERTEELSHRNDKLKFEIMERKKAQKLLLDSEERFKSAFDNASIGMALVSDEKSIIHVNQAICQMLKLSRDDLVNKLFYEKNIEEDQQLIIEKMNQLIACEIQQFQIKIRFLNEENTIIWGLLNASAVYDIQGRFSYAIAQVQDITSSQKLSDELSYQASHDSLTGLSNRREFERQLEIVLDECATTESQHALCYLDLDQFKIINDTCGHIAGDELLKQLGQLMKDRIRKMDILARLGGDEFGVLMLNCSLEESEKVAGNLRQLIEDFQFIWDGMRFRVGVSIGLVPLSADSQNLTEILKQADFACYAAKDLGRNRVFIYHDDDEKMLKHHGEMEWVTKIQEAIDNENFCLYVQAIEPIGKTPREGSHFEVLIRMKNKDGSTSPPGAFLPAAERYNLSPNIDRWVVENVFQWFNSNPDQIEQLTLCSINLSGLTLTDDSFLASITSAFEDSKLPPEKICFEITETAVIANLSSATEFINTLKNLGCMFALDDFGSGLSSFAYLKNLPVDFLKIDGMFVRDIVSDQIDLAMVKSINEIGQVMGKKTIAEFVENDLIKAKLLDIGVNYVQGYGIGKPMPISDLLNTPPSQLNQPAKMREA